MVHEVFTVWTIISYSRSRYNIENLGADAENNVWRAVHPRKGASPQLLSSMHVVPVDEFPKRNPKVDVAFLLPHVSQSG